MTCALRALPEMRPKLTIVGGRVASDLEGLGSAPEPCKSILPHNARLNRRALGNRFRLRLSEEGREDECPNGRAPESRPARLSGG